jgi:carbonic anhydrase
MATDAALHTPASDLDAAARACDCFEQLSAGHRRYQLGEPMHYQNANKDRDQYADHQCPSVAVLACADSRVPPEIIFDQKIGDLFVLRVAGNFADDDNQASMEYAIQHFTPPPALIIVLGHERCGAVKAAVDSFDPHPQFSPSHGPAPSIRLLALVGRLEEAVLGTKAPLASPESAPADAGSHAFRIDQAVRRNILINVDKIRANPVIQQAGVWVMGGRYDLDTGEIEWLTDSPPSPPA